jgi:hypothetical protein
MAKRVLPWSLVKEELGKLQRGSLGGHLGVNRTLNSGTTGYRAKVMFEGGADMVTHSQADPQTKNQGLVHRYVIRTQFKRTSIDITGASPHSRDDGSTHGWTSNLLEAAQSEQP